MFRGKRILVNPIDDYCDFKEKQTMAIVSKMGTLHEKAGNIEYKMPKAIADAYLKHRKSYGTAEEKKLTPTEYLVKVVNEEFGLLHQCVNVIVY